MAECAVLSRGLVRDTSRHIIPKPLHTRQRGQKTKPFLMPIVREEWCSFDSSPGYIAPFHGKLLCFLHYNSNLVGKKTNFFSSDIHFQQKCCYTVLMVQSLPHRFFSAGRQSSALDSPNDSAQNITAFAFPKLVYPESTVLFFRSLITLVILIN